MPIAFEVVGEFLADFGGLHARKYTRCRCRAALVALPLSRVDLHRCIWSVWVSSTGALALSVAWRLAQPRRLAAALAAAAPSEDTLTSLYRIATARAFQAIRARCLSHGHADLGMRAARRRTHDKAEHSMGSRKEVF